MLFTLLLQSTVFSTVQSRSEAIDRFLVILGAVEQDPEANLDIYIDFFTVGMDLGCF